MGDLVIENLEATAGQCRGAELKTRVFHRRSARTIAARQSRNQNPLTTEDTKDTEKKQAKKFFADGPESDC